MMLFFHSVIPTSEMDEDQRKVMGAKVWCFHPCLLFSGIRIVGFNSMVLYVILRNLIITILWKNIQSASKFWLSLSKDSKIRDD